MDETDFRLCLLLRENSRLPYRELADKVNLSVNAVHSRVGNMIENGIIGGFYTKIGEGTLRDSLKILVHGESKFEKLDSVIEELSEDKYTSKLVSTSDEYLYVYGVLPDISEMSDYVEYIPEKTGIEGPEVFLPSFRNHPPRNDFKMKRTDYEIISSLREDSRKSLSKIADDLIISTKTVRRRIDKMEEIGAIDYTIRWYPIYSDDFIGLVHGEISSENRNYKLSTIKNEHFPNIFEVRKASNHPYKVLVKSWATTLDEMQKIKEELHGTEYFDFFKTRIFYDIKYFDTWKEDLLEKKAKG
ncbi:MAG: winged helix-turn-helix transcriptional regulator [Thermoplasmata archaeon]